MSSIQKPPLPQPLGARVLVKEIIATLSLEARGKKSGLVVVTQEQNRPKSTEGTVIALGTDPFLEENGLYVGCIVAFAPLSGVRVYVQGEEYRSLELQELVAIMPETDATMSEPE
jgi:co-chaperonin GroES (HSP10)